MKTKLFVPMLCFILVAGIGCASIMHGSRQNLSVNSVPAGAKVTVKNVHVATTPGIVSLDRKETNVVLKFEKDGYQPVEVMLNREVDAWVAGNLFEGIFCPIGFIIDFSSGAAYKLTPSEVNAVMQEMKKQGMNLDELKKGNSIIVVDMQAIRK